MLAATLALASLYPAHDTARVDALVEKAWVELDTKHQQDLKNDIELGKKYSEQVEKELKISQDKDATERLQRIGREIAEIANRTRVETLWGDKRLSPFEYSFKLVEGKDVNAFSLPGGFIYFHEGLMKYAESDDEIAGVIAHEIAHASLRHIATLQREQDKVSRIQIPLVLLSVLLGGVGAGVNTMQVSQLGAQAMTSGWSVKAEQAADYAGLQYIVQSQYKPTGILTLMERLALDERNRPYVDWGIFRTHPPGRERANSLISYMRKANLPIRRSEVSTSFRAQVKPGDDGTVLVSFGERPLVSFAGENALSRADEAVKRLNVFFDSTPSLYEVSSDGPMIVARSGTLLKITKADAEAAKTDMTSLTSKTLQAIKTSIFSMNLRIWDVK